MQWACDIMDLMAFIYFNVKEYLFRVVYPFFLLELMLYISVNIFSIMSAFFLSVVTCTEQ